jgi:hypothetical protein
MNVAPSEIPFLKITNSTCEPNPAPFCYTASFEPPF